MTDRVQYLTVALDREMRVDDVQHLVDAIRMMKFVRNVELGEPVNMTDYLARQTLGYDLRKQIVNAVDGIIFPKNPS